MWNDFPSEWLFYKDKNKENLYPNSLSQTRYILIYKWILHICINLLICSLKSIWQRIWYSKVHVGWLIHIVLWFNIYTIIAYQNKLSYLVICLKIKMTSLTHYNNTTIIKQISLFDSFLSHEKYLLFQLITRIDYFFTKK